MQFGGLEGALAIAVYVDGIHSVDDSASNSLSHSIEGNWLGEAHCRGQRLSKKIVDPTKESNAARNYAEA